MLKGFKDFIMRGNVVDLAVGIVIGTAFTAVVKALVSDLFTPLLSIPGKVNFENLHFDVNGSAFRYGDFLNSFIAFLVIAAALYFFVVKPIEALNSARQRRRGNEDPETKSCPECLSSIPFLATRCAFCTAAQPVEGSPVV